MLKQFVTISVFLFVLFSVTAKDELKESVASYHISSSMRDSSISKNEARFIINFHKGVNPPIFISPSEVKLSVNGVELTDLEFDKSNLVLPITPGKYKFQFYHNSSYREIETDSITIDSGFVSVLNVHFQSSKWPVHARKPVLYFYPEVETKVKVKLELKGELGFTYPIYDNGWEFTALPNSTLKFDKEEHSYLFWEGKIDYSSEGFKMDSAFIVTQTNLLNFFEKKLTEMGLNSAEKEDFITYWTPILIEHETVRIKIHIQ